MRRSSQPKRGVRKIGSGDGLKAPLLEADRPAQAQNASRSAAFVFGNDDDGGAAAAENVEMTDFAVARGGYRRRARAGQSQAIASPEAPDDELAYVWHELEAHHTLAGIALQYRVTVEQLKSANQLANEAELVTRARLMIPTNKFGSLFANPEEHRSSDAGAKTHTTANPKPADKGPDGRTVFDHRLSYRKPDNGEDFSRGTFVVEMSSGGGDDDDGGEADIHRNPSAEYLMAFDSQMQSAIAAMDNTLQKQASGGADDDVPFVRTRPRSPQEWEIQISNWRTAVLALSVVVLISFSTVFLYKYVSAPEPHA